MATDLQIYSTTYETALLRDIIPFWEKYSPDREYGGYFTCLDRTGNVFDTDKFLWLQGRQAWTFSMLYNRLEQKEDWLEISRLGIEFLDKYGRDRHGDFYFSLSRKGEPLVQPYNIFSDCFAAMAFSQYSKASQREEMGVKATDIFRKILKRRDNPKGIYNKIYPGTRSLKNFALPMILSNLCLEMEEFLDKGLVEATLDECVVEVMEAFLDNERMLVYENLLTDNSFSDSFEGRLINPGHGIEAMWFMLDIAIRREDQALAEKAKEVILHLVEYGWDKEHGGIFYFLDVKGHPPQQLEWDQKLWWVHLETLVALAKAFKITGDPHCWEWFGRVHAYTWENFPDPEHGEWFGYLNRRGEVLLPLKGGKWKGCFHVPRALYEVWQALEDIEKLKIN
ncbi:MAG TPA: AGE family epimerase/isomerase [Cyclobacteriaceae bacterium]|nr:AGE family epimerase/isomerase [Cyclobacteriaceae bacterium]